MLILCWIQNTDELAWKEIIINIGSEFKELVICLVKLHRYTKSLKFKYLDEKIKITLFIIENHCFSKEKILNVKFKVILFSHKSKALFIKINSHQEIYFLNLLDSVITVQQMNKQHAHKSLIVFILIRRQ